MLAQTGLRSMARVAGGEVYGGERAIVGACRGGPGRRLVLAVARLTPEQGRDVLGGVSEVTGIKLGHVAELIVGWARSGQLCSDIRTELDQQLLRHAPPASAGD
ncbi:hypothetical protein [Streptomyces sp. NPDC001089]